VSDPRTKSDCETLAMERVPEIFESITIAVTCMPIRQTISAMIAQKGFVFLFSSIRGISFSCKCVNVAIGHKAQDKPKGHED